MELLVLPDENTLLKIERVCHKPIDKTFEFVFQECIKRHLIWTDIDQKMQAQLKCKNYNFENLKNIPYHDEAVNEFINVVSNDQPEPFVKVHVIAIQAKEYYEHNMKQMNQLIKIKNIVASERKHKIIDKENK